MPGLPQQFPSGRVRIPRAKPDRSIYHALKRRMLGVMTQAEAARIHGCTPKHVCLVLSGHRKSNRLIHRIEQELAKREAELVEA